MNYLIHVGLLLAACFIYYRFLLRSETYFWLNRWILLGCVILSFTLPLITIPAEWSLRPGPDTPIMRVTAPLIAETEPQAISPQPAAVTATTSDDLINQPEVASDYRSSKADIQAQPAPQPASNWTKILFWVYAAGLFVFGLHFLLQIVTLLVRMIRYPGFDMGDFRLVELEENIAPYSFWNRIFLNPAQYDPETFHQIVEHEQIHINQKHSLDILLAELLIVVQWCNPFAWWYRAAIEHNLEFLTDSEMLRQGTDPRQYQLSLVQVASPNQPQGLTSNYNQSFLEKRIAMMKTKHSSNRSAWKYLALIPLLVFSVLQLNAVDQPDQEVPTPVITEPVIAAPTPAPTPTPVAISMPSPTVATPLTPSSTANPQPEVAPIPDMSNLMVSIHQREADLNNVTRSWTATLEGQEVCFQFVIKGDRYMSTHNQCIPKSALGQLPGNQMGTFTLERYAGEMVFKGIFDMGTGLGTFDFMPNQTIIDYLAAEGYSNFKEEELIHFFYADFSPEYLRFLRKEGYSPSKNELFEVILFFDNQEEVAQRIESLQRGGFGKPSLQKLIELQIHGVSQEYIEELGSIGFDNLSLQELLEAKIHGLSANFLDKMSKSGFNNLSFDQAKALSIHGVSPEFIAELRSMGYTNLSPQEILDAKIHGVSSEDIAGLKRAGLNNISLREAKELSIHGVTPDYVYELKRLGYDDLSPSEIVNAKIHGVSSRQLAELKALGYEDISLEEAKQLAIHGVRADYITEMIELGMGQLSLQELQNAKIHGVRAREIKEIQALGYDNISLQQAKELRIHGVSSDYIAEMQELDLGQMSLSDLKRAKIHGVMPSFIKRHRDKGNNLADFIDMKIHGRY